MTDQQEIQQFECRWQPTEDMSPIAASTTLGSAQGWFARLALWVRPAHPDVGVPKESVRYEIFGDGAAALAWREWNTEAIALEDQTERRPLVARVLVGDARLLSPKLAMVLCRAGLPEVIGPQPGTVTAGASLPAIQPGDLSDLMRYTSAELDQLACAEHGLDRLIAAALSESTTALSVQLPQRVIARSPQVGSQAPLLWGLWRTVRPLLADSDSWPAGKGAWSFSTFEPPLGDKDTRGLADIVFRTKQVTQQARNVRREITVRPHDPSEPVDPTSCNVLAAALVRTFQGLGGEELVRHLETIASKHQSLDQRIQTAYETLHSRLTSDLPGAPPPGPSASQVVGRQERQAIPDAERASVLVSQREAPPDPPAHAASQPDVLSPPTIAVPAIERTETAAERWPHQALPGMEPLSGPEPPSQTEAPFWTEQALRTEPSSEMEPSSAVDLPLWINESAAASLASADRAGQDAPPLVGAEGRHARDETYKPPPTEASRPLSIASLLDRLYAGPGDPGYEAAQQALRAARQPPPAACRAAARQQMPERGWYIQALARDDPWHVEDTLEVIFRLTVIPDLPAAGVTEEIARWTSECRAPTSVIKALYAAAYHRDGESCELIQQTMKPAIYQRWLRENGIYTQPAAPVAASPPRNRAAHALRDRRPLWRIFGGKSDSEVIASILSVICAFLIVLLVLAIMR